MQVDEVHRPRVSRDPIGDAILELLGSLLRMIHERRMRDRRRETLHAHRSLQSDGEHTLRPPPERREEQQDRVRGPE